MIQAKKIQTYVAAVVLAATALMMFAWGQRTAFPGVWPSVVLLVIGFLLQVSATTARGGGAEGSLSFIVHQAGGVLFGPFWGGLVAAVSTAFSQAVARREVIKALFNVSQRTLSLVVAILTYRAL